MFEEFSLESPFGSNDEDEAQLHVHPEFTDQLRENRMCNMNLFCFKIFCKRMKKQKGRTAPFNSKEGENVLFKWDKTLKTCLYST